MRRFYEEFSRIWNSKKSNPRLVDKGYPKLACKQAVYNACAPALYLLKLGCVLHYMGQIGMCGAKGKLRVFSFWIILFKGRLTQRNHLLTLCRSITRRGNSLLQLSGCGGSGEWGTNNGIVIHEHRSTLNVMLLKFISSSTELLSYKFGY